VNLRSRVVSGLKWVAAVRFLAQLVTWSITIVVVRLLTPADYGLLAMATVFVEFLTMLAQFGVGTAIVQAMELDDRKFRQMFGFVILVDLGIMILLVFGAPLIGVYFSEPRVVPIARALSLQFFFAIFATIPSAHLSRQLKFKVQSVVELSGGLAGGATTLVLALSGFGVWALVGGILTTAICRTVGLNIASPYFGWPEFSFGGARQLLLFGRNVTLGRLLWFVYSQSDILVAGRLLGRELLGLYAVSMHLASLPVNKVSSTINDVSLPAFSMVQRDRKAFAGYFLMAVRQISLAAFPVLWGMSSIAPEVVSILLGEAWASATLPLQLIALIMPVHMFGPFMNTAAMGMGRSDIPLKQVSLAVLIMSPMFVLGSRWGPVGLAAVWVTMYPLVFIGGMKLFLPAIGLRISDMMGAMLRPALASLAMYVAVTLARMLVVPTLGQGPRMAILVLVGVVTYGALTIATNPKGWREFLDLVGG